MIELRLIGQAMFSCVFEQIILSSLELGSKIWVVSAINQEEGGRDHFEYLFSRRIRETRRQMKNASIIKHNISFTLI